MIDTTELKHSIRMYMLLLGGPTAELAAYLIKTVDFLDDQDHVRRQREILSLAFALIESAALFVQRLIDTRAKKDQSFPTTLATRSDQLLVVVGKCRSLPDKHAAKLAVLRELAEVLRALATYTKAQYPTLTTVDGQVL